MAASRVNPASAARRRPRRRGVAHQAQGVGVDRVAEQVQHGELAALGVGERAGEPVGQGGGQRPGPAERRVLAWLQLRLPVAQPVHERRDLLAGDEALAQRLPDQHGDGQRVARG